MTVSSARAISLAAIRANVRAAFLDRQGGERDDVVEYLSGVVVEHSRGEDLLSNSDFGHFLHDGIVDFIPDHVWPIHVVGHDASSPALVAEQPGVASWASSVLHIVARAGVE
jgi:hypothetical protein